MRPAWGIVAGVGAAAALVATYWDDSWHTDRGRDEFAIAPHLLLYGGVALAALTVAAWGLAAWRQVGWGSAGVRRVLADPALRLAAAGGAVTLFSAPVDAAWHEAYGRDAVLWSPPHLTAVVGTLALSVGLLAGLRSGAGRLAGLARLIAAAGVIGTLQVPVLEYDSDVAQFSTMLFLPVAALGVCTATALLDDLVPGRWTPSFAACLYTFLRALTVALLAGLGFSLTLVPPVLAPFLLAGLLAGRVPSGLRLVVLGAVTPLLWWPALQLQSTVTTVVPGVELPVAVLLGAVAGALVAVGHGDLRLPRGAMRLAVLAVAAVAVLAPVARPAWAHDPGQGEAVRDGTLVVSRTNGRAALTMTLAGVCDGLQATRVVARRAGREATGPLTLTQEAAGCRLSGAVDGLAPGRWFVYAEGHLSGGRPVQAWLPVADDGVVRQVRPLYAPPVTASTTTRDGVGAALLLVVLGVLVVCVRLARAVSASGRA